MATWDNFVVGDEIEVAGPHALLLVFHDMSATSDPVSVTANGVEMTPHKLDILQDGSSGAVVRHLQVWYLEECPTGTVTVVSDYGGGSGPSSAYLVSYTNATIHAISSKSDVESGTNDVGHQVPSVDGQPIVGYATSDDISFQLEPFALHTPLHTRQFWPPVGFPGANSLIEVPGTGFSFEGYRWNEVTEWTPNGHRYGIILVALEDVSETSLLLRYDARELGLTDEADVPDWENTENPGFGDLHQVTDTRRPQYLDTGGPAGNPTVFFEKHATSSNSFFKYFTSDFSATPYYMTPGNEYHFFVVGKVTQIRASDWPDADLANNPLHNHIFGGSGVAGLSFTTGPGGNKSITYYQAEEPVTLNPLTYTARQPIPLGDWAVFYGRIVSDNILEHKLTCEEMVATGPHEYPWTWPNNFFRVGSGVWYGLEWYMCEGRLYEGALSESAVDAIRDSLMASWGLDPCGGIVVPPVVAGRRRPYVSMYG